MVELSVEGKKQVVDIGDLVQIACEELVPHVVRAVKGIVAGADPEYQSILRNNIILSGGGSLIDGIADRVADELADIGDVRVWACDDPMTRVSDGALKLSMVMPDDQYTAIS
jgi:actin-like ATPase involved in cell morphogenesis